MGNANYRHLSSQVSQDPRTYLQNDLPKFIYHERIGNGKFMKSYLMKIDGTAVAVKVYLKPPDESVEEYAAILTSMWNSLSPSRHPNLLPYQMWIKSMSKITKPLVTPVFLVRQYFPFNLYDRLSTRPFLTDIEKLWVIYQLMRAVEDCHAQGVVHGDVKPENVMVTSWNWISLTDFAPYKPVLIPDDDPTDFHYFFDSMSRRRCYVAPERFFKSGDYLLNPSNNLSGPQYSSKEKTDSFRERKAEKSLSPAMDVFSLGCTMAEVILDGKPLLDLPSMLQYKSCCEDPTFSTTSPMTSLIHPDSPAVSALGRIKDARMQRVIGLMTQHNPNRRKNVGAYRSKLVECGVFPKYFETTLYDLFLQIHWDGKTPDDRISLICQNYSSIMSDIAECSDSEGELFFGSVLKSLRSQQDISSDTCASGSKEQRTTGSFSEIKSPPCRVDLGSARRRSHNRTTQLKSSILPEGYENESRSPADITKSIQRIEDERLLDFVQQFEKLIEDARSRRNSTKSELELKQFTVGKADLVKEKDILQEKTPKETYSERVFSVHGDGSMLFDVDLSASSHTGQKRECEDKSVSERSCSGILLVVQIICSSIRYLRHPRSKIVSLMLLTRIGMLCTDIVILERIVPFIIHCFEDQIAAVRATAIRCLRCILNNVTKITHIEINIFKDFVFPALSTIVGNDSEPIVRIAFAESIGRFAEIAMRILNASRLILGNKSAVSPNNLESVNFLSHVENDGAVVGGLAEGASEPPVNAIYEQLTKWLSDIASDGLNGTGFDSKNDFRYHSSRNSHGSIGAIVKRAIFDDVIRLCLFFGKYGRIMDLFAQLLAYINHEDWELDWELRNTFCMKISQVCTFLEPTVISEYVLPFLESARVDAYEVVVFNAIKCEQSLIEMGLFSNHVVVDIVKKIVPLLVHPSSAIRDSTVNIIAAAATALGVTDSYAFLLPQLKPLLSCDLVGLEITCRTLRHSLCSPLDRKTYEQAVRVWPKSIDTSSKRSTQLRNGTDDSLESLSASAVIVDVAEQSLPDDSGNEYVFGEEFNPETLSQDISECGTTGYNSLHIVEQESTFDVTSSQDNIKLLLIRNYIESAFRDPLLKAFRGKERTSGRKRTIGRKRRCSAPSSRLGITQIGYGSPTDLFSYQSIASLPDHLVQSLLVPHQMYSLQHTTSNELRQLALDGGSVLNNFSLLKRAFGITITQADAARALAEGDSGSDLTSKPQVNSHYRSSGIANPGPALPHQNNSCKNNEASIAEVQGLHRKIMAMKIPPLSPDFGALVQASDGQVCRQYSMFIEPLDGTSHHGSRPEQVWRPKENAVVSVMSEHSNSVNRIAVSHDQTFFVSASSDGSAKVWQTKGMDRNAFPRSALTYSKHAGKVLDVAIVENSHSVATCTDRGAIHVWRVDMGATKSRSHEHTSNMSSRVANTTITGMSDIKVLDSDEGPIQSIQHFTGDTASVLTYVTQKGLIHSWDMRSSQEPFKYHIRPELGFPTTMTCSPDRNWICVGTSLGFIGLWDIRYNLLCKLWRHSSYHSIQRLVCTKPSPDRQLSEDYSLACSEGGYLLVAAGRNEVALWGVPDGGECLKCFRSGAIPVASKCDMTSLPWLHDIDIPPHSWAPFRGCHVGRGPTSSVALCPGVRAIMGRISHNSSSYVITAGTDRNIRYWDINSPTKCFTVSGLDPALPKPVYETRGLTQNLFLCCDSTDLSESAGIQSKLTYRDFMGTVPPVATYKDAIMDINTIDLPVKMLVTGCRDGEIKLWR